MQESTQDRIDRQDLAQLGYFQQLQRSMGSFSSFAISFSLISITTGILANFKHGIQSFGPAVVWSWTAAAIGQFLVALVVAELAASYPVSGYGYQWASRIISPHLGYFVGWCLLLQFLIGFPAICATLAHYLCDSMGMHDESVKIWATIGVISGIAGIHLVGIRAVSMVNDGGVIAEIAGCIAITAILLVLWAIAPTTQWTILFDTTNATTGAPATFGAFASSLLLGAWCITGFEGAADLAEETHAPRRTVPWAVIHSELSSGVVGFFMLVAFMLSISDLAAISGAPNPLLAIIEQRLGSSSIPIVMVIVFVSILACGVASMAAATRLLFALARDNMLPASSTLRRIDPVTHSPREAILVVWLISCLVVPALQKVSVISGSATVAAYLGYAGIVTAALALRKSKSAGEAHFSLGRWRNVICIAALGWLGTAILALTLTEDAPYPTAQATAWGLAFGLVSYVLVARRRLLRGTAGPPTAAVDPSREELSQ